MKKAFKKILSSVITVTMLASTIAAPNLMSASAGIYNNGQGLSISYYTPISSAITKLERTGGSLGYSENWCCKFVVDCLQVHGDEQDGRYNSCSALVRSCISMDNAIGKYHHVSDNVEWYKNINENVQKESYFLPKKGDIIFYEENDWNMSFQKEDGINYSCDGPDHVGIVVNVKGDEITTIEGNYSEWTLGPGNSGSFFYDNILKYYYEVCQPVGTYIDKDLSQYHYQVGANNVSVDQRKVTRVTMPKNSWRKSLISGYIRPYYYLKGDVDGDGSVSISDLPRLKQYIMHDPISIDEKNADINRDGQVDLTDFVGLQYYVLNHRWPSNC